MVYKIFVKKAGSGVCVNEQLVEELHETVTKKTERRKLYARFKDNICAGGLGEMGHFLLRIRCFH